MTRPALLNEILDLPAAERLRLVEDIWDSLATSVADLPVPPWHREELDRRLADPTEQATISVDELKARLRCPRPQLSSNVRRPARAGVSSTWRILP